MFTETFKQIRPALVGLVILTILTGIVYPALVTGVSQAVFKYQANGSMIEKNGHVVGSELIGQQFTMPGYFWSRLSATSLKPYDAANSSGSNLGPTNPALTDNIKARIKALQDADPENKAPVPMGLVTASGSGLDPHISPESAEYQVHRVAKARGADDAKIKAMVSQFTESRQFGILGEPRVNVLRLNLALDKDIPLPSAKAASPEAK